MKTVPAAMEATLDASSLRLVHLVSMDLVQGTYRYALAGTDIAFGGATYTGIAGAFSEMQESAQREAPSLRLAFENASGTLGDIFNPRSEAGADQRGRRVTIRTITEADYADATAVVDGTFVIDRVTTTRTALVLYLGNPLGIGIEVPARTVQPHRCTFDYKDDHCRSESGETACPKTLEGCKARHPQGAPLPFGGFLGRTRYIRPVIV